MKTLLARFKILNPVQLLREAKARANDRRRRCNEALEAIDRGQLGQTRDALATKFVNGRSSRDLAALVDVEIRLLVAHSSRQAIDSALSRIEIAEIEGNADLMRVAFEAVSTAIREERDVLVEADAKRSEEVGIPDTSARALEELDRRAEQVRQGQGQLRSRQPDLALNSLFSVVGDGSK